METGDKRLVINSMGSALNTLEGVHRMLNAETEIVSESPHRNSLLLALNKLAMGMAYVQEAQGIIDKEIPIT